MLKKSALAKDLEKVLNQDLPSDIGLDKVTYRLFSSIR